MISKTQVNFLVRTFFKQKTYTLINIIGLSISILLIGLIVQWINYELSYERSFPKHKRLCRLTVENNTPDGLKYHFARMSFNIPLEQYIPEVESKIRFAPMRKTLLNFDSKKMNSEKVFWVDESVLDAFDLEFVHGLKSGALAHPKSIIISERFAKKFLGTIDSVGQQIELLPEHYEQPILFTIKGVFKDIADNSHIDFDVLASFDDPEAYNNWAYTYLLLHKNVSIHSVREKILDLEQTKWEKFAQHNKIHVQAIDDIHLNSHKDRELKVNGSQKAVFLMGGAALFILLIVMANLINLQFALVFKELKFISLNRIFGSPLLNLYVTQFLKSLMLAMASILIAFVLYWWLLPLLESLDVLDTHFLSYQKEVLIYAAVLMGILVLFIGGIPIGLFIIGRMSSGALFKSNANQVQLFSPGKKFILRKILLFIQFSVSLILIISSIIIWKQMKLMQQNQLIPKGDKVLVLKHVNSQARSEYAYLKQELSSLASVKSVSASLEAPPDQILDAVGFELNGHTKLNGLESLYLNLVDDNYFDFYEQGIVEGEDFPAYNKDLETAHYILNERAAKSLGFNDYSELIGKKMELKHQMIPFKKGKIGGIVKDFHYSSLHHQIGPMVFVQWPDFYLSYFIKIDSVNSAKSIADIERVWNKVHPNFPFEYCFSEQLYKDAYQQEFLQKDLSSVFAIFALILSIIGLLGIVSILANQQRKEMAIRQVLGAGNLQLLMHSATSYIKILMLSLIVSALASFYLMQEWLNNYTERIHLSDQWWLIMLISVLMALIVLLIVSFKTIFASQYKTVENLTYE